MGAAIVRYGRFGAILSAIGQLAVSGVSREPSCMFARTSGPAQAQYPVRRIRSWSCLMRDRSLLRKPFGRSSLEGQRRARQPAQARHQSGLVPKVRRGAARRRCDVTGVDDGAHSAGCSFEGTGACFSFFPREIVTFFVKPDGKQHGAIDCSCRGFQLVTT